MTDNRNGIISEKDISRSIDITKKFVDDKQELYEKVSATPVSMTGNLASRITIPGLKFENQEQGAAFVRLVHKYDNSIKVMDISPDKDGNFSFLVLTGKKVDWVATETNADERKKFQKDADEVKENFLAAMDKMAHRSDKKLLKQMDKILDHELKDAEKIYTKTRDAVRDAYASGAKHVVITGDNINNPEFILYFKAAMDEVKQRNPIDALRINLSQEYIDNAEKTGGVANPVNAYFKQVLNGGIALKNEGRIGQIVGNTNFTETRDDAWEKSPNSVHRQTINEKNALMYPDIQQKDKELADKKTLTFALIHRPYTAPEGTVVINTASITAGDKHYSAYFGRRLSDGSVDGEFSAAKMEQRFFSLEDAPNVNVAVKMTGQYVSNGIAEKLTFISSVKYMAHTIGREEMLKGFNNDPEQKQQDLTIQTSVKQSQYR